MTHVSPVNPSTSTIVIATQLTPDFVRAVVKFPTVPLHGNRRPDVLLCHSTLKAVSVR
jgi:hypothetical protein